MPRTHIRIMFRGWRPRRPSPSPLPLSLSLSLSRPLSFRFFSTLLVVRPRGRWKRSARGHVDAATPIPPPVTDALLHIKVIKRSAKSNRLSRARARSACLTGSEPPASNRRRSSVAIGRWSRNWKNCRAGGVIRLRRYLVWVIRGTAATWLSSGGAWETFSYDYIPELG